MNGNPVLAIFHPARYIRDAVIGEAHARQSDAPQAKLYKAQSRAALSQSSPGWRQQRVRVKSQPEWICSQFLSYNFLFHFAVFAVPLYSL